MNQRKNIKISVAIAGSVMFLGFLFRSVLLSTGFSDSYRFGYY